MADVEIYTPTGVVAGVTARAPLTTDGPNLESPIEIGDARWYPLDGSSPSQRGDVRLAPDDILVIVTEEPELTVHMNWFAVSLDVGPYRVSGSIATMPGFDPDRALTRPGSNFVPLKDATVELLGRSDVAPAERAHLHVNRYAVESCTSSLALGFFFPGARFVEREAVPVA